MHTTADILINIDNQIANDYMVHAIIQSTCIKIAYNKLYVATDIHSQTYINFNAIISVK